METNEKAVPLLLPYFILKAKQKLKYIVYYLSWIIYGDDFCKYVNENNLP